MNYIESDYTLLPFYNPLTAAKFCAVFAVLFIVFSVIRAIIYRRSMTLRRGITAVVTSYISTALLSLALSSFLYWQWALSVSAVVTLVYIFYISGEVKAASSEERLGVWGLNPDIRRVRGEIFNDMSLEEQLAYAKKVNEFRFNAIHKILFFVLALAVPLAFMFICNSLDIGYLFTPVLIK